MFFQVTSTSRRPTSPLRTHLLHTFFRRFLNIHVPKHPSPKDRLFPRFFSPFENSTYLLLIEGIGKLSISSKKSSSRQSKSN